VGLGGFERGITGREEGVDGVGVGIGGGGIEDAIVVEYVGVNGGINKLGLVSNQDFWVVQSDYKTRLSVRRSMYT
jgi:hypothetical protein